MRPARSMSWWLTSSASPGASFSVERKNEVVRIRGARNEKALSYNAPATSTTRTALKLWKSWRGARRNGVSTHVEISEEDGIRYLHLGTDTIQSGMRVSAPDELVLAYTRSMMAFLLFVSEPQRVVTVGLGGGSVSKWVYRHLPRARQVVIRSEEHTS